MRHRHLAAFVTVVVVTVLTPVAVAGQDQDRESAEETAAWTMPRTPDGQPDLQGYWTTQTFTPLERPERLADQEFLSEEEAALLQRPGKRRSTRRTATPRTSTTTTRCGCARRCPRACRPGGRR